MILKKEALTEKKKDWYLKKKKVDIEKTLIENDQIVIAININIEKKKKDIKIVVPAVIKTF